MDDRYFNPEASPIFVILPEAYDAFIRSLEHISAPVYQISSYHSADSMPLQHSIAVPGVGQINEMLKQLGIPKTLQGHRYLLDAISMVSADESLAISLTKRLYPDIARRHGVSSYAVERGIRYAVELCWARCDQRLLETLFGSTADPQRGKPTNGAFIAEIAHQLQKDGAEHILSGEVRKSC